MSFNAEDAKGLAEVAEEKTAFFVSSATSSGSLEPKKTSPIRKFLWVIFITCVSLGPLLMLYFFAPTQYSFYPRCLFHALTGLSCPGCGSLRALHHLLHGHWGAAFHYNALLILLLPFLPIALISYLFPVTTGRKLFSAFKSSFWIWLLLGVMVAFSILRNLPFGPLAQLRL